MLGIPDKSQFPGWLKREWHCAGDEDPALLDRYGQEFAPVLPRAGSKGVRTIPKGMGAVREFGRGVVSPPASWSGEGQYGGDARPARAAKSAVAFRGRTDRIAAGELPFAKPERPQGVERNIVFSMWEWSTPKAYLHDAISTDKRNPRVNSNGLIYGSPEESTDMVPVPSGNERVVAGEASFPRCRHALDKDLSRGQSP